VEEKQRRSLTDEVVRDPRTIVRVGSEPHFRAALSATNGMLHASNHA
jgi:hypothetical protein